MNIIQTYKTTCENCGEEIETKALVLNGENEIIIEFLEGMEFQCDCGSTTYIEIQKYTE